MNKLQHPHLWRSVKYVQWPPSHVNPFFFMPLPQGGKRSVTVSREVEESELDLLERCKQKRDALGTKLWGEKTWRHILSVKARSVSRGGKPDEAGVCHVVRPGRPNAWKAYWYERDADGKRHQRSKSYSYGTPKSACKTSEEAKAKAEAIRKRKVKDWYIADPQYRYQRKTSYREMFQKEIGSAVTRRIDAMSDDQWSEYRRTLRPREAVSYLTAGNYLPISVDKLLDIADQLGVNLELNTHPGSGRAE